MTATTVCPAGHGPALMDLRLVNSPVSIVLTSGGHNVGIVNPPQGPAASAQASYRFAEHGPRQAPFDPREWEQGAQAHAGSWWPQLHEWLRAHSTAKRVAAKSVVPLDRELDVPAPGTYVFQE